MAARLFFAVFLVFAFALFSNFESSMCEVVRGKVSCLDCNKGFDFSGIKILLKCDGVKESATATATENGSFQAELPRGKTSRAPPLNCLARILGGHEQLYALKQNTMSEIVKSTHDPNSFTISNPLSFSLSCPKSDGKHSPVNTVGSSKTVDLPGTEGLGLAPTGDYFPFLPIIGIP